MRVLVVGAGALGGYFGGRLAEAGRDVTFLVRPRRAEQIARHGLRIESPHGNADLRPRTVLAGAWTGNIDLVLLAVKAYSLDAAMDDLAPAVGPGRDHPPVLNGMRHLDALASRFGQERVLGGVAQIPATLGPEGRSVTSSEIHNLAFGELHGGDVRTGAGLRRALRRREVQRAGERGGRAGDVGEVGLPRHPRGHDLPDAGRSATSSPRPAGGTRSSRCSPSAEPWPRLPGTNRGPPS